MKLSKIKNKRILHFHKKFLAAIVLLLPILFVASCNTVEERVDKVGGVTAQQVIENPSAYVGKTVTISGDVEEIWGPRAFNMDSGASVGELLVLGREPFPQVKVNDADTAVVINDIATVTGVVRMLVEADIEREIGWDLDPKIVAEFNAKPVLVAQNVAFNPGANRTATANSAMDNDVNRANMNADADADNMNGTRSGANTNQTEIVGVITDVNVYASTKNKKELDEKQAKFTDANVVRIVGPHAFTIASSNGEEIYVILDDASARGVGTQGKIDKGDKVNVTGKFQYLEEAEIKNIEDRNFVDLNDTERQYLKNTRTFLRATNVSNVN